MSVVRAAGGLLWRDGGDGRRGNRLAIIHRPHRKDWSLPKGKLHDGETWEACALREVREETGCEGRILSFAGAMTYVPRDNPKIVLYWHMEMIREGELESKFKDEIDEVVWLSPEKALARLDYEGERRIVARFPNGATLGPVRSGMLPDETLSAELHVLRDDLFRRLTSLDRDDDAAGLGPTLDLVAAAESAAANDRVVEARLLLGAARRTALLSLPAAERSLRALALREEARSLATGDRRAIEAVLAGSKVSGEALFVAAELLAQARSRGATRSLAKTTKRLEAEPRTANRLWVALSAIAVLVLLGLGIAWPGTDRAALVAIAATSAIIGGIAGALVSRRKS